MLDHCLQLWPSINLAFVKRIVKKIVKNKSKVEIFISLVCMRRPSPLNLNTVTCIDKTIGVAIGNVGFTPVAINL